jgi:putative endonuclease
MTRLLSFRPKGEISYKRNLMPRDHRYYVYLLTNKNDKVMYVGATNQLERRMYEHKTKMIPGFTEKYNVNKLVYFEETHDVRAAIAREREIKKWRREKKNNLVIAVNPEWKDLSDGWFEISPCGRDDKSGIRRDDNGIIREVVV